MRWLENEGGNVIDMTGNLGNRRYRAVAEVETYWEALRQGAGVPRRSEIDPRGIENALEYAFVLERIAPGLARLRIAGMHLNDLMGMEVRGMPVSSFIPPAGRSRFSETLEAVLNTPATARVTLSAETGIGKPALEGQMVLLPLQSDLGDISRVLGRVLGCFETSGPIGRAPRRFNLMHTELRPVNSAPMITAPAPRPTPAGLAEPRRPFRQGPARGERPSYLRLVKSED
ncbi:PAS domain-containing protein [Marimonas lutisalis]|uniref:PAS domain-containing protein n=1 Tax=Marimonas lutisalis TaxID=2545756 RepID=UPI0010F6BEEA|nr:PAS domain-containing protein [Marimonas lutisalis]